MAAYLSEYVHLALRWLHVVAAMLWVGESLYFTVIAARLGRTTPGQTPGVWAKRDRGLYFISAHAPPGAPLSPIPKRAWHAAYVAWLSGLLLLGWLYLRAPDAYLRYPDSPWAWVAALAGWQAGLLAVACLVVGWVAYDRLCLHLDARRAGPAVQATAVALLVLLLCWLLTRLFPGRTAFLLTGVTLATWATANLAHWVNPAMRRLAAARRTGAEPAPQDLQRSQQRVAHNDVLILPIVLLMLSPHHAVLYSGPQAWLVLCALVAAGATTQAWLVRRLSGSAAPRLGLASAALLLALGWLAMPPLPSPNPVTLSSSARAMSIMQARCVQCHAARPSQPGLAAAPNGIQLDTLAHLLQHQAAIRSSVVNGTMPPGNVTAMTDAERDELARWWPETASQSRGNPRPAGEPAHQAGH